MSEKVTFGELIESIAEETEHSKQFTHDFLKDFVDIINSGLEEDGKVNIAGFGKFKLRRVDEREGYNPQTKEKITIPAHNKIVFKPYKDLRELVNAPYAHMEPQLIEEEQSSSVQTESTTDQSQTNGIDTNDSADIDDHKKDEEAGKDADPFGNKVESGDSTEEPEQNEDDFIHTAPLTYFEQERNDKAKPEEPEKKKQDVPFNFEDEQDSKEKNTQDLTPKSSDELIKDEDDNGDIVEFRTDQSNEEDESEDKLLNQFIDSEDYDRQATSSEDLPTEEAIDPEINETQENEEESTKRTSKEENDDEKEAPKTEEEVLEEELSNLEKAAKELKHDHSDQADQKDKKSTQHTTSKSRPADRNSSFVYVAAATVILLLIAGGAWYYSTVSTNETTLISSSEETTAPVDASDQRNDNNQQPLADQQETGDPQQTTPNQSQSATQATSATQPTTNAKPNNQDVEIEDGQTLWSLAEERYGNPRLWPWIYGNNGSLDNPDLIYAGSSLSVPLPSGPQNSLNGRDSVGVAKGFIATYKWYKSNEQSKAKSHLWAAKLYHNNLQQLADIPIDKTDLSYANRAR